MIKRTVSSRRSASKRSAAQRTAWPRPLALALLALSAAPVACLSDVVVPECVKHHTCGEAGASGMSGMSGMSGSEPSAAGDAGSGDVGGSAERAGGSGTASGGKSGGPGPSLSAGGAGVPTAGAGGALGGNLSPVDLPAPCLARHYSTELRVEGGSAPYSWQLTPKLAGWEVELNLSDTSHARLTSERPVASEITVAVTDTTGKLIVEHTYAVTPRTACWFAYTMRKPADGPKLVVVDPILQTPPPVTLAHDVGVYDFAFSPNGKYLSYRFGADADHPKGKNLAVVELSNWTEWQPALSDDPESASESVTAFAWSPDSSTLAISFDQGQKRYLGGTRFSAEGQLTKLTPQETSVDSALYWIGSSHVAFYANGVFDPVHPDQLEPIDGYATAFYSQLGAVGFQPRTLGTDDPYMLPVFVKPTADGYYVGSPSFPLLQFNWIHAGGPSAVDHTGDRPTEYPGRIVSPDGRLTADTPKGPLNLYRAESRNPILTSANAPDRDCPKLLTWAEGRQRIACVRDVSANAQGKKHSELRIFDLGADDALTVAKVKGACLKDAQSSPATSPCGALEYDYALADAYLNPRSFSKSGDWLAFSTSESKGSYLYLADLRPDRFTLTFRAAPITAPSGATSPTRFAFSPNEKFILRQVGGALTAYSVTGFHQQLPSFDVNAPDSNPTCSEDSASHPDSWCGSANREAPFRWSPTSKYAAYRSKDEQGAETLTIVDFARFPISLTPYSFIAPRCETSCSGQFAFQPDP
ncbi:MAG TPA: hypothetical protein VJV79_25495 [Polyangiaceae bacterium]|nr:hypothetical protein [Polyangiaceae bacterium]